MAQGLPEFVQEINSSPGIYFDPIGDLKIRVSHLDLVTPIDISYIEPHIRNINTILGTLRLVCSQIQLETAYNLECHNILEPLTIRYHDLVSEYSAISHLVDKRFKRSAWIGGIGSLAKTIFGTLSEDDGIRYDNAIQNAYDNEKRLASLIKENVLITSSVLTEFNKTLHTIKINEANLNQVIDNFSLKLKNISSMSNEATIKTNINSILNSLEASLLTLSFRLEDITNAIVLSGQNIMHPAVLTPAQLYQEIVDNFRYLPVDYKLPVELALSNIHLLLNISSVVCYSANNKIVFVLRIPLVSPKEFNLYHSLALPTPHDKSKPYSFTYVVPSNKYIALTKDRSEYCNIDSLKECIAISSREYICDVMTVISTSAHPSCESELITRVIKVLPVQCQTEFIHGHIDLWKPLYNNNWIYVQSQNNKLYIECLNQKNVEINIIGIGILTIPNKCIAYCKSTKLIPKMNTLNINVSVSLPDFSIINDSCCTLDKFIKVTNNEPPLKLQNIDLDIFTLETKSKLRSLSDETDKILNQHSIIKYETHYSVTLIVILCVLSLFCIFKLFILIKSRGRLTYLFPTSFRSVPVNLPSGAAPAPEPAIPLEVITRLPETENTPYPKIRANI